MRTVKKRKKLLLYLLTILMILSVPAEYTLADGAEFGIDGSGFTEPTYDTSMMYFWHEGIPTVAKDTQGNFIYYPVLITWVYNNEQQSYYLCTDSTFRNWLTTTRSLMEIKNSMYFYCDDDPKDLAPSNSWENYDRIWGDCKYWMDRRYPMSADGILAKLPMDVTALKDMGEAVTMSYPAGIPSLVYTDTAKNQYAISLNRNVFGEDIWLVGNVRTWEHVTESSYGSDVKHEGDAQWALDYQSMPASQFLNKDYTRTESRTIHYHRTDVTDTYKEGADQRFWTVKVDSRGKYHFWTTGESVVDFERISNTPGKSQEHRDRIRDWYFANDLCRGYMRPSFDGNIGFTTQPVLMDDWKKRENTVDNTGNGFTVYYADPNLVNFYRNSFTVAQGQVIALEGPVVIDSSCCITVKNGGVLSCSGWVINNGCINVEPGGMLIVQNRETHTGDFQYGAITSVDAKAGTGCGRIACDGTIIVSENCKLSCAGSYGLQLGATAQVANYGTIIAENMEIYADSVIENRGDSSAVFAGWGITDSGYALTRVKVTGQTYYAKGTKEKVASVRVAKNAVYGEGASRFYVNGASSVTYSEIPKSRTKVSENNGIGGNGSSSGTGQAASEPPIYYDSDYGVYFLMNDGKAYEFSGSGPSLSGSVYYWVYAQTGIRSMYKYDAPDPDRSYPSGQLPNGYKLLDGRTVNRN